MAILKKDISDAISAWGEGLIEISLTYENYGIEKASVVASTMLDKLYGFSLGPVLFKPTLSGGVQTFRPTREAALSYFVGHNPDYPNDSGFGLKPWRKVTSKTSAIFIDENVAMWMGWVNFIDKDGLVVTVDKSWGYQLDNSRSLRIILHHSSLPYQIDN